MDYYESLKRADERLEKIIDCFVLYTEYHYSYRKIGDNLGISHTMVNKYLESLASIDDEKYQIYKREQRSRKVC